MWYTRDFGIVWIIGLLAPLCYRVKPPRIQLKERKNIIRGLGSLHQNTWISIIFYYHINHKNSTFYCSTESEQFRVLPSFPPYFKNIKKNHQFLSSGNSFLFSVSYNWRNCTFQINLREIIHIYNKQITILKDTPA